MYIIPDTLALSVEHGFLNRASRSLDDASAIDVFMCGDCGYMESYARNVEQILIKMAEEQAKFYGENAVRKVRPRSGPYR